MKRLINSIIWVFRNFLNIFSELFAIELKTFIVLRSFTFRIIGIHLEGKCFIDKGFRFLNPKNIFIGKNVALGHYNKIWAFNKVYIGDYVQSAIGLTIISGSHNSGDYSPITENQEIVIEGENWIGANVTILGGVTVGRGTIIGAGSVVNKNLPSYSICVGNPCKVLRKREPSRLVVSPFGKYEPNYFSDEGIS
ncbi:acyltransferase [Mariniflexile gromovii]|uniref:Acyltransferase n=1 Tax=Mariniflexile gromovii TaxID=362523 RepID=A0ABS4BS56_9FLAO|nr:acyltransferase [Mariniflexile gromovii]MBP0902861.1 acyltransferase [Mariniflexile gromovii]